MSASVARDLGPESAINKRGTNAKKRTKKRAKRACFHCKKAKTSCSNERPCSRCVRLGLSDSCIDTPRSDINDEEKKLWETTLQYLTSKQSQKSSSQEEESLRHMIVQYARRVSGEKIPQHAQQAAQIQLDQALNIDPVVPPGYLNEPNQFLSYSGDALALANQTNSQLKFLSQQNEFLSNQVQTLLQQLERKKELERTYYNFSLLYTYGDVAYSRWSYPAHFLLDYNREFLELSKRCPAELQPNRFNVRQLHHEKYIFACSSILYLLSQGLVDYIEINQEWCLPIGEPIQVKTFLNVKFGENQQVGETILFSKRLNVTLPVDSLFKPLEIGLSEAAKARGFNLKEYMSMQSHMPSFLENCGSPAIEGSKGPNPPGGISAAVENSSYSLSPPAVSPTNLVPNPVSKPGGGLRDSLSFLESLADPDFTEFPEFTDIIQSIDPSATNATFDSILNDQRVTGSSASGID